MLSNAIMLNAHTVKIQTSKTCEHVELDDLKDDVKRSVLAAAIGSDDPCTSRKNIGGVKIEGEEQTASDRVGDYYWTVIGNTFYAKADGAPTTTDYDFYIKFDGAEPAVWVEDAEEWKSKIAKNCKETEIYGRSGMAATIQNCQVNCSPIAEILPSSDSYKQYLLNVKVYGEECEGLQGYGSRKQLVEKMLSWNNLAYYTGACFIGTEVCNAIRLATGDISSLKGATVDAAVGCMMTPAIVGFATRMNIETEHPTATAATAFILGPMTPAMYHGVISPNVKAWRLSRALTGFKSSYLEQITVNGKDTYKIVSMLEIGRDNEETIKELGKLKKTLEEIKELGMAGKDEIIDEAIKNIDTLIKFGQEGTEISGTQAIEAAKALGDSLEDLAKGLKRSIKTAFNVGDLVCGALGTLTGTAAYYAHAGGITIPTINIDMKNISTVVVISVQNKNEIVTGATE